MDRSFLNVSIPDVVARLAKDEKISLLAGPNWWNTNSVPRLNIPSVRMSDGPNGVRGSSHFVSTPAQCLPCATSLASTFDPDSIHQVGEFLAQEAKIKSSVILLAPTCNIARNPLGGRAFESFSEDPHLSGILAAAYVNGLQDEGVAATIKHFVANDQEHERTAAESVMSDRALREIYLYPFMLAEKLAKPWAYMTSYGRILGVHCAENPTLLKGILREEWGFNGLVVSDWYGTYSVDLALNAGMDLEMPGPPRWRTPLLINQCLTSQKLLPSTLDERVTAILTFVQKLARRNPDVVYGDGIERSRDSPETRQFCRKLAAGGLVLLKNQGNVLPLNPAKVKHIAVIGPNAKARVVSGGGSAFLKPTYVITPWHGLLDGVPEGIQLEYEVGCYAHSYLPTLEQKLTTASGAPGWECAFYNHDENDTPVADPALTVVVNDTLIKLNDAVPAGITPNWTLKLIGKLTFDKTTDYELGLTVAGRAKLWLDGDLVIDNWTEQRRGAFFYGQGTVEEKTVVSMIAGQSVDVLVEYTNTSSSAGDNRQPALMRGVRLGGCEKLDPDAAIASAVALASAVDAVIFIGGLSSEWEAEGFDRDTLALPCRQDETISRIAAANPNTVVVIQAGSPVSMPWVDSVAGIVHAWYSGNEAGNAIADVLYGKVNPSGRLPLTFPVRIQDTPAFLNRRSEQGQIHYREDLYVGYKHYHAMEIAPLFPFGFGLSYTTFALSDVAVSNGNLHDANFTADVKVTVTNTGNVSGSEVVQVYITIPYKEVTTPRLQLRGFAKAKDLAPGQSSQITVKLDKYALSLWDATRDKWVANAGEYKLSIGTSSDNLPLKASFNLEKTFYWVGL